MKKEPNKDIERFKPERRGRPRVEELPEYENIDWDTTAEIAKEIKKQTNSDSVIIYVGKRKKKS